jgi:FkbM family methyltransferase
MNYRYQPTCQIPLDILDQRLTEMFGPRHVGSYVEFGGHDGWHWSCTWGLAKAGWRGLLAEPLPELFEQCRLTYADCPQVTVERCAISDRDGELELGVGEYGAEQGAAKGKFVAPCWKLDTFLGRHGIEPGFDLLVVDVEGGEEAVLRGFDLPRWSPRMVIMERPPTVAGFVKAGYRIVYSDWINTIFVRP